MRHEAHMTFPEEFKVQVKEISDNWPSWKFSVIHGCPLLGLDKTYCYLTSYHPEDGQTLVDEMADMKMVAESRGIPTLRMKVERIVFDSKTGVNEL